MTELQESLKKCRVEGCVLFLPPMSDGMLPNYNEVRTALLKAGAKYKRNTFVFPNDAQPYIDRLLGGDSVNIKKEFQFFATPSKLADSMINRIDLRKKCKILEPSAGQGAIVNAITKENSTIWVDCCEIMEINQNVLEKNPNVHFICDNFLSMPKQYNEYYDFIVANPPFNKNQDIDHIYKMYDCLKKGGRIVTIASNHWKISQNKKETQFREWLEGLTYDMEDIPAGEFKESGTTISACMLIIDKI